MTDVLQRRLAVSRHAVENSVGDETIILHLKNGTYYGLDPLGTEIWRLLKDGIAPTEICRRVADEYNVELTTVEADARKFLRDLEAQGILVKG